MIIKGSLNNLPDGKMYLLGRMNNVLDSTDTKNGMFEIKRYLIDNEPESFTLRHKDNESKYRIFTFLTKSVVKGFPVRSQFFMSDSVLYIQGELIKLEPAIALSKNLILVDSPITAGKQTQALFDIDHILNQNPNKPSADEITELILKYPYSFYLLHKIIDNKNNYSNSQIVSFINIFHPEVRNSKSANALLDFSRKRLLSKKEIVEKVYNLLGNQEDIINSKLNLIVFWASWCGPCRREIPELKKLYEEYKNKPIEFISVSVDDDEKKWIKAVNEEKMPWRQLRAKPEQYDFLKMVFNYNSTIPLIVAVDQDYKVLLELTGSSEENDSALLNFLKNQ